MKVANVNIFSSHLIFKFRIIYTLYKVLRVVYQKKCYILRLQYIAITATIMFSGFIRDERILCENYIREFKPKSSMVDTSPKYYTSQSQNSIYHPKINMEYTLKDALDTLVEKSNEQEKKIEDLTIRISNNEVNVVQASSSTEDLRIRERKLLEKYLKEVQKLQPQDYAIPRTPELHVEVFQNMEAEVKDMQMVLDKLEKTLSDIQEDIKYLRNKKSGLDKMREAYMSFTETFADRTYKDEQILTKRIFQKVKDDLYAVVDTIFPDNDGFKEFLAALTSAYMKGGDDVYVNVTPQILNYVNFLLEADIVQYHRNDKTKVRMTELL